MYALDQNQVLVYSITDPENPQLLRKVPTDYGLETIVIYDEAIYIGSRNALYILDISNPANPVLLSKSERADEIQGGCDPVVVKGDYAYSTVKIIQNVCGNTSAQSMLIVYNVSSKTNPVELKSIPMSMPNGLGFSGNYLLVCDEGTDRIEIFDITVQANPVLFTSVALTDPIDLIVAGGRVIVSTKTNFTVFDISNMQNIREIGVIPVV
jgi:hypothetical protein